MCSSIANGGTGTKALFYTSEIKQNKNNTAGNKLSLHSPQMNNKQLIKQSGHMSRNQNVGS